MQHAEPTLNHGGPSMGSIVTGVSNSVSLSATEPGRPLVKNEWRPHGESIREEWYAAKCSRKEADEKSRLYENRIGMLHKKRERALRMLEATRDRERQLVMQRAQAEAEANQQHEMVMHQNHKQAMAHRDARNMVQTARAGCHIKQVLTQDRNTNIKREMNEVKAAWKATRLDNDSKDFAYRKCIHDYIHSTDVANPREAQHTDKQHKLDRTREHLLYELEDHSRVLSAHDSKMDSYASLEHSMIENVNKAQGDCKLSQERLEQDFIRSDSSYRVDRMVHKRLKDKPMPPDRPPPFTARPG